MHQSLTSSSQEGVEDASEDALKSTLFAIHSLISILSVSANALNARSSCSTVLVEPDCVFLAMGDHTSHCGAMQHLECPHIPSVKDECHGL